jgi:hypothetical protein
MSATFLAVDFNGTTVDMDRDLLETLGRDKGNLGGTKVGIAGLVILDR